MFPNALTIFSLVMSASIASAGGLERRGDPSIILFEDGKNYLEFSTITVNPAISGDSLPSISAGPTGDIANSYQTYSLGYKHQLNDQISLAFVINDPVGASLLYTNPSAFFGNSSAEVSSIAYTGMARYLVSDRFSVYGGIRLMGLDGSIAVNSPVVVSGPYNLSVPKDYQFGYLAGIAYEIPDIALRIAATYESETKHNFNDNSGSTFQVEIPQSFTLHAQTGIAHDTLLFGSARWREWSNFRVQPADFLTFVPGVGPVNTSIAAGTSDIWTYELGVGHKFNEHWSAAAVLGYEQDLGDTVGDFHGTDGYFSYGLAASYETPDWKITTGVRFVDLGDADSNVASFSNNRAISVGFSVSYKF